MAHCTNSKHELSDNNGLGYVSRSEVMQAMIMIMKSIHKLETQNWWKKRKKKKKNQDVSNVTTTPCML